MPVVKFVPTYEAVLYDGTNAQEIRDLISNSWDPAELTVTTSTNGDLAFEWGFMNYTSDAIPPGTWVMASTETFPDDGSRVKLSDLQNG